MLTKEEIQKRIDHLYQECSFYYECYCTIGNDKNLQEHFLYFHKKYEECMQELLGLSVVLTKLNDKEM